MAATAKPQIHPLTSARFFAAMLVVVFHGAQLLPEATRRAFPGPIANVVATGYIAVSFFFVLSGFVLAYTYLDAPIVPRKFLVSRIARIYPVYFLALVLWGAVRSFAPDDGQTTESLVLSGVLNVTMLQAWFAKAALSWNYPGWSLSVEAFFYFLFPMLALLVARIRRSQLPWLLQLFWALALAPAIAGAFLLPREVGLASATAELPHEDWANVIKFCPALRVWEFVIGMALGKYYLDRLAAATAPLPAQGARLQAVALGGLAVAAVFFDRVPYLLLHDALLAPLFALLIVGLALGGGVASLLSRRAFVLLGEASYSMYILHAVILKAILPREGLAIFAVYLVAVIVVSIASFKLVEDPARRAIRRVV
jgi:peptidoglycan/LPS O-acetylase OafA/YrhL